MNHGSPYTVRREIAAAVAVGYFARVIAGVVWLVVVVDAELGKPYGRRYSRSWSTIPACTAVVVSWFAVAVADTKLVEFDVGFAR